MNTTKTSVRARIDSELKKEAALTLKAMGLSMSDFIRISLTRVAHDKAIPFDIRVPIAQTKEKIIKVHQDITAGKAQSNKVKENSKEFENETNYN